MNRACDNCAKIITIPDIPLPDDYTQKCTYCGHNNPVSDSGPVPELTDWDTLDSTSNGTFANFSAMTITPSAPSAPVEPTSIRAFEDRLRDLETRLRAEWKEASHVATRGPTAYDVEVSKHVNEQTALVASSQNPFIQACEKVLSRMKFKVQEAKTLDVALSVIARSPFHVMILDQNFLKSGQAGKQILRFIKRTPLRVRRCQSVVMITPGINTCEPQVFFQWGIDLNIHPSDLRHLEQHLGNLLQLKRELLTPFLTR